MFLLLKTNFQLLEFPTDPIKSEPFFAADDVLMDKESRMSFTSCHHCPVYRVTLVVADLGWVDLYFDVPMPARFCWGQWGFGRTGWAAGQDDGTSESKSTQPRSATTSVTL